MSTENNKVKEFFKKVFTKMLEIEKKMISNTPFFFILLILVSLLSGAFVGKFSQFHTNLRIQYWHHWSRKIIIGR
jgi:hypothetical protein